MKRLGLRFEIAVSLGLLVAAAAGLMGLVVYNFAQQEMINLKIETGLVLVKAIEERLNKARSDQGREGWQTVLAATDFERMIVLGRGGEVMAVTGPWPWLGPPSLENLKQVMTARKLRTDTNRPSLAFRGGEAFLAMAVPVYQDLKVTGAVGLYSPLSELRATWTRIEWLLLLFLALDTLVTVLFGAYLLSRRLVNPLRHMIGRFEDLAAGRYTAGRLKTDTETEVGRLEESFEMMAARLLSSQNRLEKNLASLKEAQENLVRSEKMASVGRLAAGLAHELGNPLGSLIGFVHLLKRDDLVPGERIDFLNRMESELKRMDEIIRSLLDFARQKPAVPGLVDMNQAAREALALSAVQKGFEGLEVKTDLNGDLPLVKGDLSRLTQVVLNLIINAGQAMSGQGRLTVSTGRRGREVYLAVADTGPGISPDLLPQIFDPFFTTKEPGQGTGLGLSVSQSIVESHGGRIEVRSRSGEGSVFKVVLPAAEEGAG
ncbi:MAG: ATP-binding protein [Thermodesulfobacteriota bacterium]